jgi:hypothetical protein
MTVYHSLKTILVKVPKTASTSLSSKLNLLNGVIGGLMEEGSGLEKHEGILDIKKNTNKHDFATYKKIAFVRNPYDWIVSYYFYHKDMSKRFLLNNGTIFEHITMSKDELIEKYKFLKEINILELSFEDFLKIIESKHNSNEFHYKPQYQYLVDEDEKIIVDWIGRYENLNNDWISLSEELSIKDSLFWSQLSLENVGKRDHFKKYYTKEAVNIVKRIYKKDFDILGYSTLL